ncbi:MAG: PilW family protein [Xanthomonadales bacterium]|nr:PilW family protein [Xanthomonadales bacterium]
MASRASQRGVSLIELMVAITIAMLVTLGLIQIFGASRASSQMQEGLSRVQENGRFITQQMQRQFRMVGFSGCAADSERVKNDTSVNHMLDVGTGAVASEYRFQRPVEGFTVGTSTTPTELADDAGNMIDDNDALVLRTVGELGVPVFSRRLDGNNLVVTIPSTVHSPEVIAAAGDPAIYALENCVRADFFEGSISSGQLTANGLGGLNVYDPADGGPWSAFAAGKSLLDTLVANGTIGGVSVAPSRELDYELHRAEYVAFYIKNNAEGVPSLYMRRFERTGTPTALGAAEELVAGVDGMQLRFGFDDSAAIDGTVDEFLTTEEVIGAATTEADKDARWRRVLSIRVALLLRSEQRAGVSGTEADGSTARSFDLLGVTVTPPDDGRMRQVYETTIAVRNRIFNS